MPFALLTLAAGRVLAMDAQGSKSGFRSFGLRGSSRWTAAAQIAVLGVLAAMVQSVATLSPQLAAPAEAAASCPAAGCAVTVDARDFASGAPLEHFNYIVNRDNTKLPSDP